MIRQSPGSALLGTLAGFLAFCTGTLPADDVDSKPGTIGKPTQVSATVPAAQVPSPAHEYDLKRQRLDQSRPRLRLAKPSDSAKPLKGVWAKPAPTDFDGHNTVKVLKRHLFTAAEIPQTTTDTICEPRWVSCRRGMVRCGAAARTRPIRRQFPDLAAKGFDDSRGRTVLRFSINVMRASLLPSKQSLLILSFVHSQA